MTEEQLKEALEIKDAGSFDSCSAPHGVQLLKTKDGAYVSDDGIIQALRDRIVKLEKEREAVIADLRKRLKETEGREARIGYQYAIMVLENPDWIKAKEVADG